MPSSSGSRPSRRQAPRFVERARKGSAALARALPHDEHGLYTGTAGLVYALGETWRLTGDSVARRGARRGLAELEHAAKPVGAGVAWNDSTDIISGSAGIGLTLLWAARALDEPRALAARAGERLLELAQETKTGLSWEMRRTKWLTQKAGELTNSYRVSCSARDMARFGLLALRGGRSQAVVVAPCGALFIDLALPIVTLGVGLIPVARSDAVPVGARLEAEVQVLAIGVKGANFSNPATLRLR